jgi:hypothetical protein
MNYIVMLASETRALVKDQILAQCVGKIDQCSTVPEMVPPTITVIKELAVTTLTSHFLYLSTVENPQEESKELADDLNQTVKML